MPELIPFEPAEPTKLRRLEITSDTVELTARVGKKIVVDEILASGAKYVDIYVGTRCLIRVPLAINDCKFSPAPGEGAPSYGIMNFIRKYLKDIYITVPEGQKLTLKFDTTPSKATLYYYELNKDESIGEEWSGAIEEQPIFFFVTHSQAVSATATYKFDTAVMPTGFLEVKDGFVFPANVEFELKILAFGAKASGSTEFTHLHIWAQDVELFTPDDHKGIAVATANNELKFDITKNQAFMLSTPYVYKPGYKILLTGDATYDGSNTLAANSAMVVLGGILRRATR